MQYAGFWKRFVAAWIDLFVLVPLIALWMWLGERSRESAIILDVVAAVLIWLYPVFFLARWGQTLGKMAVKIKVRTVKGERIGWSEAVRRSAVDGVLSLLSTIGTVIAICSISATQYASVGWMERQAQIEAATPAALSWLPIAMQIWGWGELLTLLFNKKRRALHDFIAGTVVVVEEKGSVSESAVAGE